MIESVRLIFWLLSWAALILLVAGLVRPWVVLWWEDTQNRWKVIRGYGLLWAGSFLLYWLLGMLGSQ